MDKEVINPPGRMNGNRKIKIVLITLFIALICFSLFYFPPKEFIQSLLVWTQEIGFYGYFVVIIVYILACLLFLPGSIVTLASGFLFGVYYGSIVVSIGSTLGASAAFLTARFFARNSIQKWVANNKKFHSLDAAVGKQGFKIVLLTRLSPIFPFNFLNYAFGLTNVSFREYVIGSWLGMIPGTILYVYLGSTAQDMAQILSGGVEGGAIQTVIKIIGLVATIVITVIITRIAKNALIEETKI